MERRLEEQAQRGERRAWPPLAQIGVVAMVAALVVAVGACLTVPPSGQTGPSRNPTPSGASPSPEPSPSPSPAPTPSLVRASLESVDRDVATPTFVDRDDLVPFVNSELGYELVVPQFWGAGTDHAGADGVHDFGSGRGFGTRGFPALQISVGIADGDLTLCQGVGRRCETVTVDSLDDLEEALVSVPDDLPPFGEVLDEIELVGTTGRTKRPETNGHCLGCPGMLYHAFTIVDDRPVVISIDWWTIDFGELPQRDIGEILSSFRFID